jgi:hypothetical protein
LNDLLCGSDKKAPAQEKRNDVGTGREAASATPAARPLRERRGMHKHPYRPEDDAEEAAPESCTKESLLITPHCAALPVATAARQLGWSAHDIPLDSGDRLHRVAVVANTFTEPLRPPKMARPSTLAALRPKSKAECERRCGSDGFCDPSDLLGCGGVHCGQPRDILA